MKTILLIIALVASLALGGNSLAVSHGSAGEEILQPTPPSDLLLVLSEFADKKI